MPLNIIRRRLGHANLGIDLERQRGTPAPAGHRAARFAQSGTQLGDSADCRCSSRLLHKGPSEAVQTIPGWRRHFIACDREQELLLPPSLREWLPEDHLAWFVLEAVEAIDLKAFFVSYRQDGWGRAAHDPAMMVALLLYAYAISERSSRRIERRCHDDVAVRVITANRAPDQRPSRGSASATRPRSGSCLARCSPFAPRQG